MTQGSPFPDVLDTARALINALLDGRLNPDGARQLEELVCDRAQVRQLYVRYVHQECVIGAHAAPSGTMTLLLGDRDNGRNVGEASATDAGTLANDGRRPATQQRPKAGRPRTRSPGRRTVGIAAVFVISLSLLALVIIHHGRRDVPFATMRENVGARWESGGSTLAQGNTISAGILHLTAGVVRLTFEDGADVIIEGPAQFGADSKGRCFLNAGKLSATVPSEAHGFSVRTPSGIITDLGTEFAVSVDGDGSSRIEVFTGKVQVQPAEAAGAPPALLEAGQAAVVAAGVVSPDPGGAIPQRFVRSLASPSSALDVIDLIAGGDGTTHRRGLGIDAFSGRTTATFKPIGEAFGDGLYHRVAGLPVIDGCFVPDGSQGPMKIDSEGHRFAFPSTNGKSFGQLWGGGAIAQPGHDLAGFQAILNGVDYSQGRHGYLFMHSNKALTLDLAEVRRVNPSLRLARFRATLGNSATLEAAKTTVRADSFVIVDGKSRFERRGFTNGQGVFALDVALDDADRYLTLATTDGGDGIHFDWVLWADPIIEATSR